AIDADNKQVILADGSRLAYQQLLLATGSRVREFDLFPYGSPHVHYLRTLSDALQLRQDIERVTEQEGHLLVIGAGMIGLAVAAVAATKDLKGTVVEVAERPLARAASPALAAFLSEEHERHGVDIRCSVQVLAAQRTNDQYSVHLSDGTQLHADLVLGGIGGLPTTELAQTDHVVASPQGIVVDGHARSNVPDIYAAGEVAFHFNAYYDAQRREETWQHAVSHGSHVAQCMLGGTNTYAQPMSYWTDQYDYSVQVFGAPHGLQDVTR